jgi:RNA polymerase sigma factor (sigma-70 family)
VNLVYSAALRQVRSSQLAEEITQSVFSDLAKNADKLKPETILTAWLYQVARRTAIDVIRKESRRQLREQIAVEMNAMNATANDWTQIEPLLDDAMAALDETDRSAILLRYFENKNLREVGETLGTNEDAAQKRVSRAVEKLREFFSKRNVTIGTSGLTVLISANAVQAAPLGLAATISAAAILTGTTISTSTAVAVTQTIAMTTKILIAAALIIIAGAGIFEAHQATQLREQNKLLSQQIVQLQTDNENLSNRFAEVGDAKKLSEAQFDELLKLRGEMGVLRRQLGELTEKNHTLQDVNASMFDSRTNSLVPQIHIKARFIAIPKGTSYGLEKIFGGQASEKDGFSGILDNKNFQFSLQELQSHDGVETLAEPEAVTTSGRQMQMRATQAINVLTNFTLQESNNTPNLVAQTTTVETGPVLDVIPRVLPDGYTIELPTIAQVTDFLGYAPATNTTPAYTTGGQEIDVPTVWPQFYVQQATNSVNLLDNQTLLLMLNGNQVPANASFQQLDGNETKFQDKKILVFITATLVDAAGNRVHTNGDNYTNIPPQTSGQ